MNHVGFFQDYADPDILELIERFANLGIEAILLVVPDHLIEERLWLREKQMNRTEPDAHRAELAEQYKKQQDDMLFAVKNAAAVTHHLQRLHGLGRVRKNNRLRGKPHAIKFFKSSKSLGRSTT